MHPDFDGMHNFAIFASLTLMWLFMDTGGKAERIFWTIVANVARAVLLVLLAIIGVFTIVIFNTSGNLFKDFSYYVPVELILAALFLLLIWGWTPKKQRWIWVFLYLIAAVLMLFYY